MVQRMMEFDRSRQSLLIDGMCYTSEDVERLTDGEMETFPSAVREVLLFLKRWFDDSPVLTVHTSGSTGVPKQLIVRKDRMMQSARLTCEALGLYPGDKALLCMNLRYIGAMMVVVRSLVAGLNLIVRPASGHPLCDIDTPLRFAAMVPLQVYNTLSVPSERRRLEQTDILIIGGSAVDDSLLAPIHLLPGAVYSTYGMTETLSHIALRRLNGDEASDYYIPFPSVSLSQSADGALVINAPLLCDEVLYTNDIVHLCPDNSFLVLGRKDNIINSGGIKIQAEEVERLLRPLLKGMFVITAVPDARLGEAVVLLAENLPELSSLRKQAESMLPLYHCPRYFRVVEAIPQAGNGKIDRMACRRLAKEIILQ